MEPKSTPKVSHSKKQSSKKQVQPAIKSTGNNTFDPRVRNLKYTALHMALLVSYIITTMNCKFQFLTNPQNQAESTKTMIRDIYNQQNTNTMIVIILKYSTINYGVLLIDTNAQEVYYNETQGTTNQLYNTVFMQYFRNAGFTVFTFNSNFNTTQDNVGVYAIHIITELFRNNNNAPPMAFEGNLRDDHYQILVNNDLYKSDYKTTLKQRLNIVSFSPNQNQQTTAQAQAQPKPNSGRTKQLSVKSLTNTVIYDPRVDQNYQGPLMIVLAHYILDNTNLQCKILANPRTESTSTLRMITVLLQKKKLITILIILKYTTTNYGVLIFDNDYTLAQGEYFETHGGLDNVYTNVFRPFLAQKKITIHEYTTNFKTTENNVGVYAMYGLNEINETRNLPTGIFPDSDTIRTEHYQLLQKNGVYNSNFNGKRLLNKVVYNEQKNSAANTQAKQKKGGTRTKQTAKRSSGGKAPTKAAQKKSTNK